VSAGVECFGEEGSGAAVQAGDQILCPVYEQRCVACGDRLACVRVQLVDELVQVVDSARIVLAIQGGLRLLENLDQVRLHRLLDVAARYAVVDRVDQAADGRVNLESNRGRARVPKNVGRADDDRVCARFQRVDVDAACERDR
jgi:hypothetical protein